MSLYNIEQLMVETRRIAKEYYLATKKVLPVSSEIAKFDAIRLLDLQEPKEPIKGVDAVGADGTNFQVKCRVIFDRNKTNYRIGQLNPSGGWDATLLVLLDDTYEPYEIYRADRAELSSHLSDDPTKKSNRGAMSLYRFMEFSDVVWTEP